ncbi:hypothetical protein [Paenibacillus sp. QZ-Y1]|uniref:hypothetical protein n=1 Tax=Paenibacillus sp. QZ-Y1 TaxID=3414511 RepID=UPI003F7A2216
MNADIELLKYQIKLLKMVIGGDSHPYFMYLLDHDVTEEQSKLLHSLLASMNNRRHCLINGQEVDDGTVLIPEHTLNKLQHLGITDQELNANSMPNYIEFAGYIEKFMNNDINPEYLLKAMHRQSMFSELCGELLKDK